MTIRRLDPVASTPACRRPSRASRSCPGRCSPRTFPLDPDAGPVAGIDSLRPARQLDPPAAGGGDRRARGRRRASPSPAGMAAISAALLARCRPGRRGRAAGRRLLHDPRLGGDGAGRRAASRVRLVPTAGPYPDFAGVRLVLLETPANPGLDVCDIAALAAAAHAAGALVAVDNTTATPLGQRPLDLGADLVVASGTKALTGHSDLLLGYVATPRPGAAGRGARLAQRRPAASRATSTPGSRTARWPRSTCGWPGRPQNAAAVGRAARRPSRRYGRCAGPAWPTIRPMWSPPSRCAASPAWSTFDARPRPTAVAPFLTASRLVIAATSFGGLHTTADRRAQWGDDAPGGWSGSPAASRTPTTSWPTSCSAGHHRPDQARTRSRARNDQRGRVTDCEYAAKDPHRRRVRRSQHRARDLRGQRRQHPRRARPRRVRRGAGRHHPRRPLGAHRRRPGVTGDPRGQQLPEITAASGDGRGAARRPDRRRAGRARPGRRAPGRWATSTWCSRRCTAPTARTARSRACWRWPASRTSAPACSPPPPRWTRSSPRSSPPPRASRSGRTRCCGPAPRCPTPTGSGSGCRSSSSPPGPGPRTASPRCSDWADLDAAIADGPRRSTRRCWSRRRSSAARSSAACSRARPAARPRRRCWPRSASSRDHEFYDFEAKYLDDACEFDIPADLPDRRHPPGPGVRLPDVRRAGLRRAGPGRLLRHRRTGRLPQRDQHDARASRRRRCSRGCGPRPGWSTRSWSPA